MIHAASILAAGSDTATGVGIPLAVAAGLVSFLSPCVLPLVPGYLSTVIGVTPADLKDGVGARRVLVPSLLFITSFSLIFILYGLGATAIGSALIQNKTTLEQVSGVIIVVLGALFVGVTVVPALGREWHVERLLERAGRGGPLVAGAAFAIAWTPCIGPTLGAILNLAANTRSEAHAAVLLAFYSAGLAVPFLATALAFRRMTRLFAPIKRHYGVIVFGGGAILVAMGILMLTGEWTILNTQAQNGLSALGINFSGI
jgi:cytochrome c-type biogenesis protein